MKHYITDEARKEYCIRKKIYNYNHIELTNYHHALSDNKLLNRFLIE